MLCPNLQQESGEVDALLRKGEKDWTTAVEISVAVYYTQEYGNRVSNPEDQIIKLIEETNEGYKKKRNPLVRLPAGTQQSRPPQHRPKPAPPLSRPSQPRVGAAVCRMASKQPCALPARRPWVQRPKYKRCGSVRSGDRNQIVGKHRKQVARHAPQHRRSRGGYRRVRVSARMSHRRSSASFGQRRGSHLSC